MTVTRSTVDTLELEHILPPEQFRGLLDEDSDSPAVKYLFSRSRDVTDRVMGRRVRVRGLIEITNICRNNCLYCGLRRDNRTLTRYALTDDEILDCCRRGHEAGFRTFVLQGGENPAVKEEDVCRIVSEIHRRYPDSAITLSLGEWPDEAYRRFREAGATRYLLRHETHSASHYSRLHPREMSLDNRLRCLDTLKRLGYQTGTGIMVGSPWQTLDNIAEDLEYMARLQPEMIGIGPFLPHSATPFARCKAGSLDLTLRLIAILRLMFPQANIPSTTALATLSPEGRIRGIQAGANVVMPNLSPQAVRDQYSLYNNKAHSGAEAAEGLQTLSRELETIGFTITTERGDYRNV